MSKNRCIAEGTLVYWCTYHDAEWPSGWTECLARNPNASGDGRPPQRGDSRTNGVPPHRREEATPVAATIRRVPR